MKARILIFAVILIAIAGMTIAAQTSRRGNPPPKLEPPGLDASGRPADAGDGSDFGRGGGINETRERWRIRAEEKEHNELLERAAFATRISAELKNSFAQNQRLDADKINELEKIVKKIRKTMGVGGGDESNDDAPKSLADALSRLAEISKNLNDELKKSSRHEVSVNSIENITDLLQLIDIIRSFAR